MRSHQVIRALARERADLRMHVRTSAPEWLFLNTPSPVVYSHQALDVGIIQRDSLKMEIAETLDACRRFHERLPQIIETRAELYSPLTTFVSSSAILRRCASRLPRAAAIPSVSITNFTWDFIYRAYLDEHRGFVALIDQMTAWYGKTSLALMLPYPCDTEHVSAPGGDPMGGAPFLVNQGGSPREVRTTAVGDHRADKLWRLGLIVYLGTDSQTTTVIIYS